MFRQSTNIKSFTSDVTEKVLRVMDKKWKCKIEIGGIIDYSINNDIGYVNNSCNPSDFGFYVFPTNFEVSGNISDAKYNEIMSYIEDFSYKCCGFEYFYDSLLSEKTTFVEEPELNFIYATPHLERYSTQELEKFIKKYGYKWAESLPYILDNCSIYRLRMWSIAKSLEY